MQTGKKIVWVGTAYFADSGKMMPIRDTNTIGMNEYNDLGEVRSGGAWRARTMWGLLAVLTLRK